MSRNFFSQRVNSRTTISISTSRSIKTSGFKIKPSKIFPESLSKLSIPGVYESWLTLRIKTASLSLVNGEVRCKHCSIDLSINKLDSILFAARAARIECADSREQVT